MASMAQNWYVRGLDLIQAVSLRPLVYEDISSMLSHFFPGPEVLYSLCTRKPTKP